MNELAELRERIAELKVTEAERKQAEEKLKESEEKYRSLINDVLDSSAVGIFILDSDFKVVWVNDALEHYFGLRRDEVIGKDKRQLIRKHIRHIFYDPEGFTKLVFATYDNNTYIENFECHVLPDGEREERWLEHWSQPIRTGLYVGGRIEHYYDITERKRAEERAEHLSLVLRAIRNVNQLITKEKDRDKLLKGSCDNLIKTRGYSNAWIALLDESGKLIAHAESGLGESFLPMVERLKRGQLTTCGQWALQQSEAVVTEDPASTCTDCPLSSSYAGRSAATVRLEYEGKVYGFLSVSVPGEMATDVEDLGLFHEVAADIAFALHNIELEDKRKQAEENLRESEAKIKALLNTPTDAMILIDSAGIILAVNSAHAELLRKTTDEIIGKCVFDFFPSDIAEFKKEQTNEVFNTGNPVHFEESQKGKIFATNVYPVFDAKGKVTAVAVYIEDITERKKAEQELSKKVKIIDTITDAVITTDLSGNITSYNAGAELIYGYKAEEVIGKPISMFYLAEDITLMRSQLSHIVEGHTISAIEARIMGENEKEVPVIISLAPIRDFEGKVVELVGIAKDLTERKEEQEKLMLTDRLASVGELASGIAHEINNPLTSIIGFSELLLERDISDDIRDDLKTIVSEARRTAEVVKNLLIFARKHIPVKQLINVDNLINKVLQMRAYEQRVSNIQVITQFAPDMPEVVADYFQLQQVFLNIIINAEHFMIEAHNRGTLTITTERVDDIIRASFADDGPGISQENLGHLFDPFFTTKEVGSGTGLGLSICHGIMAEHGGRIYAESELGKGATFVVELPIGEH